MKILKATISDAPEILKLQKAAYVSEAELHNDFNIPPLTQNLKELEDEFNTKIILKIVVDGNLVASGQVHLINQTCHIGRMAVWPNLKGQGIGSQLLRALESYFPSAKKAELFTGVNSLANLGMYARRGYKKIAQKQLGKTTIICLEKNLIGI